MWPASQCSGNIASVLSSKSSTRLFSARTSIRPLLPQCLHSTGKCVVPILRLSFSSVVSMIGGVSTQPEGRHCSAESHTPEVRYNSAMGFKADADLRRPAPDRYRPANVGAMDGQFE